MNGFVGRMGDNQESDCVQFESFIPGKKLAI